MQYSCPTWYIYVVLHTTIVLYGFFRKQYHSLVLSFSYTWICALSIWHIWKSASTLLRFLPSFATRTIHIGGKRKALKCCMYLLLFRWVDPQSNRLQRNRLIKMYGTQYCGFFSLLGASIHFRLAAAAPASASYMWQSRYFFFSTSSLHYVYLHNSKMRLRQRKD